jgi:hypothetical protein
LKSSKNSGLIHIKYNIIFPIILYYSSTLTNLNQILFWGTSTSSNLIDIWEKLPKDWKLPLKGGGEHNEDSENKEDSQKDF